jgi:hypothetical protein
MAHFAEIDLDNKVKRVVVVHNNELLDEGGLEQEAKGSEFCHSLFGGTWLQTSYNGTVRKNFAGAGYTYDNELNAFIPPKPFPSWLLDEKTCQWVPPVTIPEDGDYSWDETQLVWVLINENKTGDFNGN